MASKRKSMKLASDPPEEARPSMVIEYFAMAIGTRDQHEKAHGAFEALAHDFHLRCKELGVQLQNVRGGIRPLTREESITLVPRKFHLDRGDGVHFCTVPFVSKNQLTTDVTKITCKLCLKKLREQNDRLEAASSAGNS